MTLKSKNRKKEEQYREKILLELPPFINQLLLLLNSGMVLQEAMITIAIKYETTRQEDNPFATEYCDMYRRSINTGKSILYVFNEYCKESHIKELSRIAGILVDSDKKGTDLWEKLSNEGEELWRKRKQIALQKIKLSESKMSFPLGLLLFALIIITAAPAMMQMYID